MNLQETAKLLTMIQSLYPNQMKTGDEVNIELTTKLWQKLFKDDNYKEVCQALFHYASLNRFMPHPSDLKDYVAKSKNPEAYKSAELAWEEVSSAIRKFGFYRMNEAFTTFDDKTKRVVKSVGWGNLCHSERVDVLKKNFCSLWDNLKTNEQETLKLPIHLTNQLLTDFAKN